MHDPITLTITLLGFGLLVAGFITQIRTHQLRKQWAKSGRGIEERATGLASIAAIPVLFPIELETALATDTQLAVLTFRRYTEHPECFGRRLANTVRSHETGWRIDYDLFAVTINVTDRNEAVLAADRIGIAVCGGEMSVNDLRVGIAVCPDDGDDLLDVIELSCRRMRGFSILHAVAIQLRKLKDIEKNQENPSHVQVV